MTIYWFVYVEESKCATDSVILFLDFDPLIAWFKWEDDICAP